MIKWHILVFIVITASLYAAFHFGVNSKNKKTVIDSVAFLNDWRLLVFFLGIYLSFSVKKISDISNVSRKIPIWRPDKSKFQIHSNFRRLTKSLISCQ